MEVFSPGFLGLTIEGPGMLGDVLEKSSLPPPHPLQLTNAESTLCSGSIVLTVELADTLASFPTHLNKSDLKDQSQR